MYAAVASPAASKDRASKRVLAVGARDSVLDLASDPKSRFGGMARDMLRTLLTDQYLLSVCRSCWAPHAQPVYWLESDCARMDDPDNEGRELVFLCDKCTESDHSCEHCHYRHALYDTRTPLEQRPPVFEFAYGRGSVLVAARCVVDALACAACARCGVPDFLAGLHTDTRTPARLCMACMKAEGLAPCGRCHGHIDAWRVFCDTCAEGDPELSRTVARCSAEWCFDVSDLVGTLCPGCQMVSDALYPRVGAADSESD